ncbi:uncharacterized protein STEHIDRAFT_156887 [Stereum hirsutum FP-91666 SS1]|uniref:uncharacterized protein n=1 Tax=Stereum hirsutum (strain FP-91666) TaxID=721885 RepID=UPI000440E3D7|nr:uncharacterized protein STEHIDRAFT_156887 [Stereum hirsutum FP-91666 SS1]EIM86579.1 hypothetical protein STEHIDRAFT_156887 [Stereum hirsutum FP-91666 SS1]
MSHAPMLCDNVASVSIAITVLESSPTIILDCEGRDLGEKGGALSIIILSTTSTTASTALTFLIDVLRLSPTQLQSIYDLLSSPHITKVVFDGRMDYSALYHECGVEVHNVLDMQLADIASRGLRGEQEAKRLERLWKYLGKWEVEKKKDMYEKVVKINGMKDCLSEHEIFGMTKDESVRHDLWTRRPLPKNYASYAATDARMIHALYDLFTQKSFITSDLSAQSMRYVTICKDHQPTASDAYAHHPLLPLDILEAQIGASAASGMRTCDNCRRSLSEQSFVNDFEGGGTSPGGNQGSICWESLRNPRKGTRKRWEKSKGRGKRRG